VGQHSSRLLQWGALGTYLNLPFLYTRTGLITEEIAPIEVNGETCRRLKLTFPRAYQKPYPRTDLVLRPGLAAAPP
jgi:hypothetical protein